MKLKIARMFAIFGMWLTIGMLLKYFVHLGWIEWHDIALVFIAIWCADMSLLLLPKPPKETP